MTLRSSTGVFNIEVGSFRDRSFYRIIWYMIQEWHCTFGSVAGLNTIACIVHITAHSLYQAFFSSGHTPFLTDKRCILGVRESGYLVIITKVPVTSLLIYNTQNTCRQHRQFGKSLSSFSKHNNQSESRLFLKLGIGRRGEMSVGHSASFSADCFRYILCVTQSLIHVS